MLGRFLGPRRVASIGALIFVLNAAQAVAYQTEIRTTAEKIEVEIDPGSAPTCAAATAWSLSKDGVNSDARSGTGSLKESASAHQEVVLRLYSRCEGYCNYGSGSIYCKITGP